MSILSSSLSRIKPSPTIAVTQKARELKEKGVDVISLGAGEPDFDTPDNVKEAAIRAINSGDTKYTAVDGTPKLKEAIINKFKKENGLEFSKDQINVGAGGKQVIFNAILSTINPGDEVLIPAPYWVSYPDIVLLAGGTPKIVICDEKDEFKITSQKLKKNLNSKTKWIILNSPSNPTGSCYSKDEIDAIADILKDYPEVMVMSDDIYEHVVYDNFKFYTIAQNKNVTDRTLTINGVSKSYAMTGWRIGYAGGPKDLIKAMAKIQSQSTTNPSSISQAAAVEALSGDQSFIKDRSDAFKERRDFVVSKLNKINGIECLNPQGAFYVFPSCKGCIGKTHSELGEIKNDTDFVSKLLESTGVAVVQGSAFGLEGFFRISYATSMTNLEKAVERISDFCSKLS
ncbi:MAG: pyridoxal phosphate-dependent aminotransferase [Pelagibacteraceae bacterium]|jgi:aspartate aminotransferase|nr:pyridoxal phosphate-dependent aminotransferase [Pelagibacteraceae bacterium]MCI5079519.1 pyridoxal phosphate-dependent aminotransferase [Pelagibacteraceae bacterium]|tara:strand:+ start:1496 stop:2695 length:1200 start_codon:yes stop_codon:yes gene_type:complete